MAETPAADAEPAAPQSLLDRAWPILRVFFMWYAFQTFMGQLGFNNQVPNAANASHRPAHIDAVSPLASVSSPLASKSLGAADAGAVAMPDPMAGRAFRNAFSPGDRMALRVYVSPLPTFSFADLDAEREREQLRWLLKDLTYSSMGNADREDAQWTQELNVTLDDDWRTQNSSLYAHVFLTKAGFSPNPQDDQYAHTATTYRRVELVSFRPRPKIVKTRNLLSTATTTDDDAPSSHAVVAPTNALEAEDDGTFVAVWKPSILLNVVFDTSVFSAQVRPPPFLAPHLDFDKASQTYAPILYDNQFWNLEDQLQVINATTTSLPLAIAYYPIPVYKFAMYTSMEQNFRNQQASGATTAKDTDQIKRMFLDTNPYLLGITMVVSLLHSLFDFLAFKNDVSFWKNQKSLAGLSLRSIALNTFFQLVIFLYLLDNDTSWMVLMSSFISLLIECWKIKKAIVVTRDANNKLQISGVESYASSPTAEHDRVAVAHLSYVLYPLIVGYAVYSLAFGEHKGWYSWVVKSLTSFVYMFGFIMMTPQLYINYKLKSVAHLPWRAMVYKSLNTFIDDLFAFVIKMPWMHRLSCFRDDLIFFIYLYQRWKYPVDATRTNEFGQPGEEEEADKEKKDGEDKTLLLKQAETKEIKTGEGETTATTTTTAEEEIMVDKTNVSSKYLKVTKATKRSKTITTTDESSS